MEVENIFNRLQKHCQDFGITLTDGDFIQLRMLANSIALYEKYAAFCNEHGCTQKPDNGGWDQIRPEYTAMQKELVNVLKYGAKFGLNPADRIKMKLNKQVEEDPLAELNRGR